MKKLLYLIIGVLTFTHVSAQNSAGKSDDAARIAITALVPKDVGDLTPTAQKALKTRLDRIITASGIGGSSYDKRFVMAAKIVELTKDVSVTTPLIYSYTLEVTLIIGDAIDGTLFSSYSFEQKGAGNSETKAYMKAIKGIKSKSSKYADFITEGKTKIIEYYNSKCDFLQKEALVKADKKEYEEAITDLLAIPEVCKECYMASQDLTIKIFKMKMENECMENIQKATIAKTNNKWDEAASYLTTILPDVSCYTDASALLKEIEDHRCAEALGKAKGAWASMDSNGASKWLGEISADSKCYSDAIALGNEIKAKLKEDENKEWEFTLKKQQDNTDIQKATIKAARDIGVAYGENQPKTVTYNYRSWW
jgi:hypothetical protein